MASAENKPIRTLSWDELAIGIIFTWLGEKVLNFLWNKARPKIRLEGKTHFVRYLFVMFGTLLLLVIFGWLIGSSRDVESSEFEESVDTFLRLHRKYDQFKGRKPCSVCSAICWNRMLFEKFIPNPTLARTRAKQFSKHVFSLP